MILQSTYFRDIKMRFCKHSEWLGLSIKDHDITLNASDRLQTLVDYLPDPDKQKPSLFVVIGNKGKAIALRQLLSLEPKWNGKRPYGELHLHIDATFVDRPILIADGDLPTHHRPGKVVCPGKCHETIRSIIPCIMGNVSTSSLDEAVDNIYMRLLSPFTDVFCFFATDLGGFRPIVRRLAAWLDSGQSSTLPRATRPQVVIVTEVSGASPQSQLAATNMFRKMLRKETRRDLTEQFADLHVMVLLPLGNLSDEARHRRLKEHLLNLSDQVRAARIDAGTYFSARHFAAFFKHACSHLATTLKEPFDFIRTSRTENMTPTDLSKHLSSFLLKIKSPQALKEFAIPVIASSILLDNYPPDMHCKQLESKSYTKS